MATRKKTKKAPQKTNPIESPPILRDYYHDLKPYAELPEYEEYREAMIFLSNSMEAQEAFDKAYFKDKKEGEMMLLRLDARFLHLCKLAKLRHTFLTDFILRFEDVPSDSLQKVFNELHHKIGLSFCVNMTARPLGNGKLMVVVWAEKHQLPLEKVDVERENIEYLLRIAENIKVSLEEFIRDLPWLEKIEKLERENQELREKQMPSFPMGFPGMCPGMGPPRRW